jgi:cystathionine beta-synthase
MRYSSILDTIGNTPSVRLNRIGSELACDIWAKCEFLNPGGSIKDRIALKMIETAEQTGQIKPGDTLIEPTSGNTGIGLAMAGAVKGYQVIITMPEKMSQEKQVVLEALGATIYRTPTEAAWDAPESHISLAKRLRDELPNAHILDQYSNPANPQAHYDHTATEILADFDERLKLVIIGAGTGGTVTGVAKKLKEQRPDIRIIGVDPIGSILSGGDHVAPYEVEGIGYDFIPDVLDNNLIDEYIRVNDTNSFHMARRLICEEGLLVGGSSGAATWAALQAASSLQTGEQCLVIIPDGIRNYLSKFVNSDWMQQHGFS